jgi:hypothetical protein
MFADYQEFAAAFARRCCERRNAEEAQREQDELMKPATVPSTTETSKTSVVVRANSEQSWQAWVEERIGQHLEPLNNARARAHSSYCVRRGFPVPVQHSSSGEPG